MNPIGTEPDKAQKSLWCRMRGRYRWLAALLVVMIGVFGGVGLFTFVYGDGAAYLTNNPESCVNCHVMRESYNTWMNSGHRHVAVCNDCHLPHDFVGKWLTKGDNGFFHSLAFTTGNFHEPIQIKARNRQVTQNACISCHKDMVSHMLPDKPGADMLMCIHCHSDVGHAQR